MSVVINSLPFLISIPGEYILGSDFVWSDFSQSAITVNASNVKLDFVGKKVQLDVSSVFPIVSVIGNETIILKNIYLEALGPAINNSAGIKIYRSKDVIVESATLLNLGGNQLTSFYAEEIIKMKIEKLNLRNTTSVVSISLFIYNSQHIKFYNSNVVNGRCVIRECQKISVKKLFSDNSASLNGTKGRCIQVDSLVGLSPVSPFSTPAKQFTNGVKISHCHLVSGLGTTSSISLIGIPLGFVGSINDFPIYNVCLKKNRCISGGEVSILSQYVLGYKINYNHISTQISGIVLQTSSKGLVKKNTIRGNNTANSLGISVQSSIQNLFSENNLIVCNNVEGFTYLYSDNDTNNLNTESKYTFFKNNSISPNSKIFIRDPTTTYIPHFCEKN